MSACATFICLGYPIGALAFCLTIAVVASMIGIFESKFLQMGIVFGLFSPFAAIGSPMLLGLCPIVPLALGWYWVRIRHFPSLGEIEIVGGIAAVATLYAPKMIEPTKGSLWAGILGGDALRAGWWLVIVSFLGGIVAVRIMMRVRPAVLRDPQRAVRQPDAT